MQRKDVDPVVTDEGENSVTGQFRENHNAFGLATVSRGQGSGRSLFQSDILHSLKEAAESVVSQATADIEAHILRSQQVTGQQASIEAPDLGVATLEIETNKEEKE